MKTVINNEGKKVKIPAGLYDLLSKEPLDSMILIKDEKGQPHMILIWKNF